MGISVRVPEPWIQTGLRSRIPVNDDTCSFHVSGTYTLPYSVKSINWVACQNVYSVSGLDGIVIFSQQVNGTVTRHEVSHIRTLWSFPTLKAADS